MRTACCAAAALLFTAAPPPRSHVFNCAPLNTERYGRSSLYVSLDGKRSIQQVGHLPPQPADSVRLVFVSDTHSQLNDVDLPLGDVLCHTGDITFCAHGGLQALEEFNRQLKSLPHKHKIVIAGNHDRRLEQLGRFQARRVLSAAHYLENSAVKLMGLTFWGTPFSTKHKRKSSNSAFQYSEEFQKNMWRYVPNEVDVLLTHGSIRDSTALAATIERAQPYLHAHGHDHELHGCTLQWGHWSVPSSTMTEGGGGHGSGGASGGGSGSYSHKRGYHNNGGGGKGGRGGKREQRQHRAELLEAIPELIREVRVIMR